MDYGLLIAAGLLVVCLLQVGALFFLSRLQNRAGQADIENLLKELHERTSRDHRTDVSQL